MDNSDSDLKPSVHAVRAYDLILSGVAQCETALDQRLLLNSIICQGAILARILTGEVEFHDLLERLKHVDLGVAGGILPMQSH